MPMLFLNAFQINFLIYVVPQKLMQFSHYEPHFVWV